MGLSPTRVQPSSHMSLLSSWALQSNCPNNAHPEKPEKHGLDIKWSGEDHGIPLRLGNRELMKVMV